MLKCEWHLCQNESGYSRFCSKKCTNKHNVAKRRRDLKTLAIEYKGGCCQQCGYNKCTAALQFHHLDPNEKEFGLSVGGVTRAWSKVKAELDKCVLLCANCHAETHAALAAEARPEAPPRPSKWPSQEELISMVKESSISSVAKLLSASTETVRKRMGGQTPPKKGRDWPPLEELEDRLKTRPATRVAKELGVSDVAVKKHIAKLRKRMALGGGIEPPT